MKARPDDVAARPDRRIRVLIVAGEPVADALLGMLLDPAEYDPVFPMVGEQPDQALDRLHAPIVLLLDGTLPAAHSDALFVRATERGAVVVLFAPPERGAVVDDLARRREVAAFALPIDQAGLSSVLAAAVRRAVSAGLWVALAVAGVAGTVARAPVPSG